MTHEYDTKLVILSVLIAMLASYAALNFASQITTTARTTRVGWLVGGATVMGGGIWSMHFVGMLSFHIDAAAVSYDLPLLIASLLVAIGASLLALVVASRAGLSRTRLLVSGILMGTAIAGMHYIGMASMRLPATLSYDLLLVAASVVIAVGASIAALWLAFRFSTMQAAEEFYKPVAAVVMGLAIAGMHYTAMAAAHFTPAVAAYGDGTRVIATSTLGVVIAVSAVIMLILAIAGSVVDKNVLRQRAAHAGQLEMQSKILQSQNIALETQKEELTVQTEALAEQAIEQEELNEALRASNTNLEAALAEVAALRTKEREANEERARFLQITSHELRTPLGAIGGYLQLLLMGIRGPLSPEVDRDLRRAEVNQQHCLRLVNEILDLARLEAGQMPINMTDIEFRQIVEDARPMLEPQLNAKHIQWAGDNDKSGLLIRADRDKVQQIVINLVANSIRFTPDSGTISVSALPAGGDVELRVSDSGPGIPQEKAAKLFVPYSQLADGSTVGTGLGLAISRQLARAMGGDLRVEPCDHGATFVLTLCAAQPAPASESLTT